MSTQIRTGLLTVIECANCHMDFGITAAFEQARRDDHKSFYCPAGHIQWFPGKSAEEKLRDQLESAEKRNTRLLASLDQTRAERLTAERRVRAMKGVVTKTRQRVAAGKCVRCSCTFPDLAAHMSVAHPDFAPAD